MSKCTVVDQEYWNGGVLSNYAKSPFNTFKNLLLRMYDYVTKELPELVAGLFPVDPVKMSVTGTKNGVRTFHNNA